MLFVPCALFKYCLDYGSYPTTPGHHHIINLHPLNSIIPVDLLGPIYTKRQRQCCDNSAMTLAILFSLKTMELLQNGVTTYFQVIPLISMRTESQASSQSCRSIDADAWCKRALKCSHHLGGWEHNSTLTHSHDLIFILLVVPSTYGEQEHDNIIIEHLDECEVDQSAFRLIIAGVHTTFGYTQTLNTTEETL